MSDEVTTLRRFMAAWNDHDVDGVMSFFADDAVFLGARGGAAEGERLEGREAIRAGVEARFARMPDLRFSDDEYMPCGPGAVFSQWTMTGTSAAGTIEVRGCDLYRLRDGRVVLKDSYLKARD